MCPWRMAYKKLNLILQYVGTLGVSRYAGIKVSMVDT